MFSSSSRNKWLQGARWDWRWQNFRQDFFLDVACVPIVCLLSIGSAWGLHSPWNLAVSIAKTLREFDKGTLPVWLTSSCDFSWQEFLLDLFRNKLAIEKSSINVSWGCEWPWHGARIGLSSLQVTWSDPCALIEAKLFVSLAVNIKASTWTGKWGASLEYICVCPDDSLRESSKLQWLSNETAGSDWRWLVKDSLPANVVFCTRMFLRLFCS